MIFLFGVFLIVPKVIFALTSGDRLSSGGEANKIRCEIYIICTKLNFNDHNQFIKWEKNAKIYILYASIELLLWSARKKKKSIFGLVLHEFDNNLWLTHLSVIRLSLGQLKDVTPLVWIGCKSAATYIFFILMENYRVKRRFEIGCGAKNIAETYLH